MKCGAGGTMVGTIVGTPSSSSSSRNTPHVAVVVTASSSPTAVDQTHTVASFELDASTLGPSRRRVTA